MLASLRRFSGADALRLAGFVAGYSLAILGGEALYGSLSVPSPFWFPDSVLLAALLLTRREHWWLWILVTWPIRLVVGGHPGTPVWFVLFGILNDSIKGPLAAWWLGRLLPQPARLQTLTAFVTFLAVAAGVVPVLSAIPAAVGRHALGNPLWSAGYQWFLGDALAQAIVTPTILYWCTGGLRRVKERFVEASILFAGLVGILLYAFLSASSSPLALYAPVPFLLWAAVRLGPFGTANAIGLLACASVLGAVRGTGPFSAASSNQAVLSIQLFLLLVSVSLLSLAILIVEREERTRERVTLLEEQQRAERALRESDARFRLAADTAPVVIWVSGPDKLCTFFNKGWLRFTGRSMEQELGNGWSEGVHPDDLQRCLAVYSTAFDARLPFKMEYRLRRHDGKYRWIVDHGVPRFDAERTFLGYIGSCLDITASKRAARRLRLMSGRLITAEERERARTARDLHDDVGQRMALLQINADRLGQHATELSAPALRELRVIVEQSAAISLAIRNLSHQLHPSTLDSLGLVVAVAGLCRDVSEQHHLNIPFTHDGVPAQVDSDVSRCLFRITQEALQNVVKHSGAAAASVELLGSDERLSLSISDRGAGFDLDAIGKKPGLGLISMRERLRSVGGRLAVESDPSRGTVIRASVPVRRRRLVPGAVTTSRAQVQ